MPKRPWLTGLAVFALALAADRAVAACTVGVMADLPVTMAGTQPTVPAKINGAQVRFIADSGAFYSLISPASATELGLKLRPAPFLEMVGVGGETRAFVTTVKEFTLANVPIANVDFLVGGSDVGGAGGAVGLLGQNVLRLADVEYDLANGAIRLVRPKDCGEHALAYWVKTEPFSTLAIGETSPRAPQTTGAASVNGVKVRAVFDTGAAMSILSLTAARRAGIDVRGPGAVPGGPVRGIGRKTVETWIVPVASFKIGGEEIRNTRLRVGAAALPDTEMTIGADFFLSHRIYVANSQRKLYFTYNGGPVFNLASTALTQAGAAAKPTASAIEPGGAAPTDAAGFARRGAALAGRRDFALAIADFDRAIALDPKAAEYFDQRALARLGNKQPFLAMADLDQALALRPHDVQALIVRANLRLGGKDGAGAIADLDAADRAAPKEDTLRLPMAALYGRADAFASAVPQYDLWLKYHPDDSRRPAALNGRCWARGQLGQDLQAALADCTAALKLAPKNAAILDSRGLVRLRLGDLDGSIADYDAALAMQPKIAWSLYGRGLAKLKKGAAADGAADLAAATALQPGLPEEARKRGLTP